MISTERRAMFVGAVVAALAYGLFLVALLWSPIAALMVVGTAMFSMSGALAGRVWWQSHRARVSP